MPQRPRAIVRPWLTSVVVIALTVSLIGPAVAQPSSDEVRRDIGDAQEKLEELENRLGAVVDSYNETAEDLASIEAELAGTEDELARLKARGDELRRLIEEHVVRLHKLGPAMELSAVMLAGDPSETGHRIATFRRVLDGQWADVEEYEALGISVGAAEERLEEQRRRLAERAEQLEQRHAEVEEFVATQQGEIEELEQELRAAVSREEEAARRAEELRRQQAAERARQERLEREARQREQAAASQQPAASEPASEPASSPAPAPRANAQVAVDAALSKLGSPYRWGATGPNAFDCSGLMVWAWAQAGVSLPRSSAQQFAGVRSISRSELQPGDLVFAGRPNVHHVGMYIGNGQIVHSPHSGTVVSIRSMERHDLRGFGRPG